MPSPIQEQGFSRNGTWIPTDASGAGLVFSNTSGNCRYLRIGDLIVAIFRITWPATGSGAAALIGGLPLAATSQTTNSAYGGFIQYTDSALSLLPLVGVNLTTFNLYLTNGITALNSQLSGKDVRGTVIYEVNF